MSIGVNKYGAKWVQDRTKCAITFDKSSLKLAIDFLLDQCYFNVGNLIFRQVIDIPMGSDPAPFMANLFCTFMKTNDLSQPKSIIYLKLENFRMCFVL